MSIDTTGLLLPKPEPRATTKRRKQRSDGNNLTKWRNRIWTRDKAHCRCCGRSVVREWPFPNSGECHHLVSRQVKENRWDVSNGILVCAPCHQGIESNRIGIAQDSRFMLMFGEKLRINGDADITFLKR